MAIKRTIAGADKPAIFGDTGTIVDYGHLTATAAGALSHRQRC